MPLHAGAWVGRYEVLSAIGAGGMGEVYRARDSTLNRDVALKILPEVFASDPERLARFAREAQVLASLNHGNIAVIHGIEETDGVRALVLELVEGPTLADIIARGPLPLGEALRIGGQIAEALQAAHEQGIVHRDLKPANIKVRPDGTVKVLDFGLAKLADMTVSGAPGPSIANSPTITAHTPTGIGMLVGTAAYMSPEQAAGKPATRRSDLWAFGVVLLEMLTGRPAFSGESVSHVLAAVLKSDPEWAAIPDETPAQIRRLLRRCLQKDPRYRLDSAADARLEIADALARAESDGGAVAARPRQRWVTTVAALAAAAALGALATWAVLNRQPREQPVVSRFVLTPRAGQPLRISPFEKTLTLSRDGRQVIYSSRELNPAMRLSGTSGTLMVRPLDQLDARAASAFGRSPFVSPDGTWIGFFDDNDFSLKKISINGGPVVNIATFVGGPRGASWDESNTIVFATGDPTTGLRRVPAGGGEPILLTTPDVRRGEGDHLFPSVLPGGRGILFTIVEPGRPDDAQVAVLEPNTGQHRVLIRGGSQAEYLEPGYLVYGAAGTLRAVRFDLATLQVAGDHLPVVENVMMTPTGTAYFAVSREGTLVYVPATGPLVPPRSLVWVDRQGREEPTGAPSRAYASARLSPDGTRVAVDIRDQENDIWIWELGRGILRKLTQGPAHDWFPIWTPDGENVIFTSDRAGIQNLYLQAATGLGTPIRLTTSPTAQWATAVAPQGAIVGHQFGASTSFDLFLLPGRSSAKPLVQDPLAQSTGEVSPDGRYLVYQSNESGGFEIYVRPFPDVDGAKWQVSTGGGTRPVWAKSGRELFYLERSGSLVALPVETSGSFSWGNPVAVLRNLPDDYQVLLRSFDVAPDGKRFLMLREQSGGGVRQTSAEIVVVLNWIEELKAKLPLK
jgi:serine/threonine-protein kinase